jgi:hypothetical protein
LLGVANAKKQIRKSETGRVVDAFLFGAGFAEVHFLHLPVHDLGQKNRRFLGVANITLHRFGQL